MKEQELTRLAISEELSLPYIAQTEYDAAMTDVVEPWLAALRQEAEIPVKGGTLHAEYYLLPGARKAVLMLHGYTESAEKFREVVWYYLKAGISVFSYDHRGHGRSLRQVADESITHVDRFSDYVDDAQQVITQLVQPRLQGAELYLFGHSMGGAVAAHLLQRQPDTFVRCILSSPMIMPATAGVPLAAAVALTTAFCLIGRGKSRAFVGKPFDAESEVLATSCSTSSARFEYYKRKRVANRYFQNCSPTYGWTRQAILQNKALMKKNANGAITIPVLLMQASMDDVVLLPPQDEYISTLVRGRISRLEGKHELFNSKDDVMQEFVKQTVSFLLGTEE